MTPTDGPGAPLDVATLGVMARRAASHPLVDKWGLRPDRVSPRRLVLRLDHGRYPDAVMAARIDVRWFENDDYTLHYVESRDSDPWQCRWDCHPKPDAPAAHFHPPPDAGPDVERSPLGESHHLGVLFDVLDWVEHRVRLLHGD